MKKKQESVTKEKSPESRTNVASGTPDIASGTPDVASGTPDVATNKPKPGKPGTSGTWGGGWGKPVTDLSPEEHLDNR
jgi:hypothetical protein